MSGEQRQSPPGRAKSSPKQGPLKATIAISSATKQGSRLKNDNNTVVTPPSTWRTRSADGALGRRSSDAANVTNKSKFSNNDKTIRKTASLDSIYLRGLFPRDRVFWRQDRSTQTDVPITADTLRTFPPSEFIEDRLAQLAVRGRRRSLNRDSNIMEPDDTVTVSSQTALSPNLRNPNQPKSSRSSEEGLNQEVESYTTLGPNLNSECDRLREPTPEGRRAPVADLLLNSPSLLYQEPRPLKYRSGVDSHGSSPEQDPLPPGSSPRMNLSREPPDGCEKVSMKPILKPVPLDPSSPQQRWLFQLKQSSHSAFECLQKDLREADGLKTEQRYGREKDKKLEDTPKVPEQLHLD